MRHDLKTMRRLFALGFVLCFAAGFASREAAPFARLSAQKKKEGDKDKSAKPAAAAAMLAPDKGKFRIVLEGQVVGGEEFEISPSGGTWMARGSTTAHVPGGGEIKATGQLKLAADGTPIHYEWTAQAQKKGSGAVDFANGTAKSAIDLGGKSPFTQDFTFSSPRVAVLDNNLYYQYAVLAQLYDWKAGGKQVFPVLIPQDMTPGSISVESIGPQQVENAKYETLRVSSPDLEILLYLDAGRRLMRVDVPSSKAMIERE
jgi:hypothetical protein